MDSLFQTTPTEKQQTTAVLVEGITSRVGFDPVRLAANEKTVKSLLLELSSDFQPASAGGGMSFLKMPFDKHGQHWGEQPTTQELMRLGLGLGLMEYNFERAAWSHLPGGVPYLCLTEKAMSL